MSWNTLWNEGGPSGLGYSEIEAFLRCPKEYQYAKIRGVVVPMSQMPSAFAIGSFMHAGRARWFAEQCSTSGETWNKIRRDVTDTRQGFQLPCADSDETTALRYIQEYINHWSMRTKPKIVAVEHMLGPVQLTGESTERTARLDDFGFYPEAGGKLVIGECKTTSGEISTTAQQYELHGQPVLQKILWDLAPQGGATWGAVHGTILDVVKKGWGGKKCEFARIFIPSNPHVEAWWKKELAAALKRKAELSWDSDAERRITSCTRLVGKMRINCPYKDLCTYGASARTGYSFEDGRNLDQHQPSDSQTKKAWE